MFESHLMLCYRQCGGKREEKVMLSENCLVFYTSRIPCADKSWVRDDEPDVAVHGVSNPRNPAK